MFESTHTSALARLQRFIPRAGRDYASVRNYDDTAHVSTLSPYLRHRIITEEEVLRATLSRYSPQTAEKFVQEVYWRTYWKGWLEQRPRIWTDYRTELHAALNRVQSESGLRQEWEAACKGETGIECFDHWARQLAETGYLHNHARMWFASIWIFTLGLPWELGADFFLRHLMDGDPASNTLAWRWVAGIQTKGRPYVARVSNISKFTDQRFSPLHQLNTQVEPLSEEADHQRHPLPNAATSAEITGDYLLLVTEDDMQVEETLPHPHAAKIGALATTGRSLLPIGSIAQAFARDATRDACTGAQIIENEIWAADIIAACQTHNLKTVVTGYAPVGPVATKLVAMEPALQAEGIKLFQVRRAFDTVAWPYTTKGFFAMKKGIPRVLEKLGLSYVQKRSR